MRPACMRLACKVTPLKTMVHRGKRTCCYSYRDSLHTSCHDPLLLWRQASAACRRTRLGVGRTCCCPVSRQDPADLLTHAFPGIRAQHRASRLHGRCPNGTAARRACLQHAHARQ